MCIKSCFSRCFPLSMRNTSRSGFHDETYRKAPGWETAFCMQAGVHQKDACAAVINVPKIAMLFLATKGFPHAAMWSMWFQQVRGLVPRDCVAQAFCQRGRTQGDPAGFNELIQACGPSSETPGVFTA